MSTVMIHVINRERDTDRMAWMESQLSELCLSFKRKTAVEGAELDPGETASRFGSTEPAMKPSEIGCLLSHEQLWAEIAERSEPLHLVLEDDVHLSPALPALLEAMAPIISGLKIARLETVAMPISMDRDGQRVTPSYGLHRPYGVLPGTGAYLLSLETARYLSSADPANPRPVDLMLFDINQADEAVEILQCVPAPCIQDQFCYGARRRGFGSAIGERPGVALASQRAKRIKRALRPAYWAFRSLLKPKSLVTRQIIPFR